MNAYSAQMENPHMKFIPDDSSIVELPTDTGRQNHETQSEALLLDSKEHFVMSSQHQLNLNASLSPCKVSSNITSWKDTFEMSCIPGLAQTLEDNQVSFSSSSDYGTGNTQIYHQNFESAASHGGDGTDTPHSLPTLDTPTDNDPSAENDTQDVSCDRLDSQYSTQTSLRDFTTPCKPFTISLVSDHTLKVGEGHENNRLNDEANHFHSELINEYEISIKDITPEKELPPTFTLDEKTHNTELLREFSSQDDAEPKRKEGNTILSKIRKVSVGITGSAMVLVGIPMIPAPTPGGVVVVGGGMALLATEFPAAGRALDKTRERLAKAVAEDPNEENDESDGNGVGSKNVLIRDSIPLRQSSQVSRQPNEYMEEIQEVRRKAAKAFKGTQRNVKKFIRGNILPIMERLTKRVNDEAKKLSPKRISSMRGSSNATNFTETARRSS